MSGYNFVFIDNIFSLESLQAQQSELLAKPDTLVVTLSMDILASLGPETQWEILQDWLPGSLYDDMSSLAFQLVDEMFPELSKLQYRGVPIYAPTAHSKNIVFALRNALLTHQAFQSLCQTYPCKQLYLFTQLHTPSYGDLALTYETDLLQGVMAYLAVQANIPVVWLQANPQRDRHSLLVRHIADQTRQLNLSPIPLLTPQAPQKFTHLPCIFSIGHGEEVEQVLLNQFLSQSPELYFVHLSFDNFFLYQQTDTMLKLDFRLLRLWPHFIPEEQELLEKWPPKPAQELKLAYPFLLANPFIQFQFDWLLAYLRENYRIIEGIYLLKDVFQPQLCITGSTEGFSPVRMAGAALKTWGVQRLNIQHGGNWTQYILTHPPHAEYMALRGHHIQADLEKVTGIDIPQYRVVGDFRKNSAALANMPKPHALQTKGKLRIALITSYVNNNLATICRLNTHHQNWAEVGELAQKHPEWEFWIKTHPAYDHYSYYQHFLKAYPLQILPRDKTLKDIAPHIDLAISFNAVSSSLIELASGGIPCLIFGAAINQHTSRAQTSLFAQLPLITSTEELEQKLLQLQQDPPAMESLRLKSLDMAYDWSAYTGQDAVAHAWSWIQELMVQHQEIYQETNSPLGSVYTQDFKQIVALAAAKASEYRNLQAFQQQAKQFLTWETDPIAKQILSRYLNQLATMQ